MGNIIGLTGKTGAGKSTVSDKLKQLGAFVVDGDVVSREVLAMSPELLVELERAFGGDIAENGVLDRRLLASRAFKSEKTIKLLNSILHPAINNAIMKKVNGAFESFGVIIVDAAAIIESGFYEKCDKLAVVTAPESVRLERITERDEMTVKDALIRIKGQKPDAFYEEKADFIIKNYPPFDLDTELEPLIREIFG